ncbi:hypothetical protein CONCODRAFT_3799 [Conidiobolus coronatus NRRL 28638]|uniref:Uncharacterized protein n=1 Tax=Conidiobolus coronatus (strain ATCC 28846 / CBS 209.66 / NRRL 28638) TaxID=796925 RepID=A0A137PEF3_CONC2|nr:hypothetical protein CONCODRAFT_3799 [Conidiobolus coronatus NRRL 28638]|eukprot:KXN73321.1 hypothetical protein CONCODRAFT_3799 [Conidiobolus coronatus NRRL 28638]
MKFQYIALSVASLFSYVKAEENAVQKVCPISLLSIDLLCNLFYVDNEVVRYDRVDNYAKEHNRQVPFNQEQYNKCYQYLAPVQSYDIYAVQAYYPGYIFVY